MQKMCQHEHIFCFISYCSFKPLNSCAPLYTFTNSRRCPYSNQQLFCSQLCQICSKMMEYSQKCVKVHQIFFLYPGMLS